MTISFLDLARENCDDVLTSSLSKASGFDYLSFGLLRGEDRRRGIESTKAVANREPCTKEE